MLNACPVVMEYFPAPYTREQTVALIERSEESFERFGLGLFAVDDKASGEFIGCVGLINARPEMPFGPQVEVGWRIVQKYWGHGLAVEAAAASMKDGYARLGLEEIIAITARINKKSMRVMEKLSMSRDPADDFLHPAISVDSPICAHVLYRSKKEQFLP